MVSHLFGQFLRAVFFVGRRESSSRRPYYITVVGLLQPISHMGCGSGWFCRPSGYEENDGAQASVKWLNANALSIGDRAD